MQDGMNITLFQLFIVKHGDKTAIGASFSAEGYMNIDARHFSVSVQACRGYEKKLNSDARIPLLPLFQAVAEQKDLHAFRP